MGKHKGGRPPMFGSAEELQAKIDQYFDECKGEPLMVDGEPYLDKHGLPVIINAHPPTVTGLALALGFKARQSLIDYGGKAEFADTIARAKMRVEDYCEGRLFDRDGQRGAEFSLRYNFRWAQEDDSGGGDGESGVVVIPGVTGDG